MSHLKTEYLSRIKGRRSWYIRKRSYDTATGMKTIAYNLMIISNMKARDRPREIKKIVSC